ncbi:pyruvate:ferredoxin (flavodoxin) oxidoreductase [Ethanoligenens harbinense]|uniref:Pyruvate:ferredoxin oxidoreductase n=1 Tax=Ethanoligenens harbinense (strain DSM 18485 / JCM 12961 / CGMCC 1.5033 / YUAN-3) TaxID=663278 RepID=E6U7V2_ETHHY|nr:pyruvate:ferredoxin (flavodoxin) oxidoreductase [Ethanoligenens harbinense]ADU28225.1 pyruvate ferredoxin/flavodoxin oxidoreductase [Ethanoligenens harbinense YUAN-3]AVQ97221.1 pyruvate:ferredoxin (flavodoxin) oxidoreductase [Ethanoligenens harbinense YUAN-3]AYF39886.1 pyruvate:ferredoxin (flavodoxin) oxidoreductase [Ethanoligenens harbinense]AYF42717.1 pyruvate:ferredoxin (flavodoxin) oxidoreductase [Ethanoligenens harbinense]QCN93467.1 pyruvate:ferredoxin (flavodoxin) oxidoreductase [Etha
MARKMKTMDGNAAAAHVSYAFTDVAGIYPITPSSVMAEHADEWAAAGRKNIFGQKVRIVEMQSEGGAAGTVHGSLNAGALTTTFTASQGLLLMIPNMYKIAGELLPGVIHVSARCVASHALNIFGDHSDVYACRQTGFAMLCAGNVQEVMDLGAVAHLSAIKGRVPFLHFFDGFRTSHEIQKIEAWDYEDLADMVDYDAVAAFRARALNPEHPTLRGTAQNPDIFFQAREACNTYYDALPAVVEEYMNKVNAKIGTDYKLFNYYGAPDAEKVIIAMGSVCDTIEETVDYLNAKGEKVGLVKVRLYRPFSVEHLLKAIPSTVKSISVLDRTKEPGSLGEPLYLDVVAALRDTQFANVPVYSGRYGLGSKDTIPGNVISVYSNAGTAAPKKHFTIGIEDDVTDLSLPLGENPDTTPEGTTSCKFWGLGSDGTVGANKNSIKIIGDHTDMYAQGYFAYDSKKSGGVTISHLRFGKKPIKSTYLVSKADFVACHNPSYVDKYDIVEDLKDGGTFLLNTQWTEDELEANLPAKVKRFLAQHNINFYIINGIQIGKDIGLGGRINTVLQSAFFKLTGIIPAEDAVKFMKDAATASYGRKGEKVVKMNHDAIDAGAGAVKKVAVPAAWADATDEAKEVVVTGDREELVGFVKDLLTPMNAQRGDALPVSAFKGREDGTFPQGSAAYEKRGIAVDVPEWQPENCIQCNFCSYVCPHAVIRPFVLTADEAEKAPASMKHKPATALAGFEFSINPSVLDCTGCGSCANVCPGLKGNKALVMKPLSSQMDQEDGFLYGISLPEKPEVAAKFKPTTVKGSQFKQPLLEFSGACAGCGETPYAKLATQLFGDRMYIANATGCSSIWGGSAPSTPYTVNKRGYGPSWANSLFEDNAEFGYGMFLGQQQLRDRLADKIDELAAQNPGEAVSTAIENWKATKEDGTANREATDALVAALEKAGDNELAKEVLNGKDFLAKKSVWILGGDGWAYDIGFGGLDHVVASGEDINVLIFDTEVYSNTGGQASKSTPAGSVAQFAAAGKSTRKKDLAGMLMSYGYVYVAQVAMGADYNQCLKAFNEAESYHGPSVIIAYAPCINHGIRGGMGISQTEEKKAVQAGYWNNFRFDPRVADEGKNPFTLDSKAPSASYQDFIRGEVRYSSLLRSFPERAEKLFAESEKDAKEKYEHLVKLADKD